MYEYKVLRAPAHQLEFDLNNLATSDRWEPVMMSQVVEGQVVVILRRQSRPAMPRLTPMDPTGRV
jgi:hypothetical protein